MSGNRVEELESKVRELEATIDGLTDELVETKERLETIEEEAGIEPNALDNWDTRGGNAGADEKTAADAEPSSDEAAESDESEAEDDEEADSTGDDIIVA